MTLTKQQRRQAMWTGATLGIYQAHALACPPIALFLFMIDHPVLAVWPMFSGIIGWVGWKRDFNLQWRPWNEEQR